MFGMTAVYRGNAIFGVLPTTRAMETRYSVSFKIPHRNATLDKCLKADPHVLPHTSNAKWLSFELQSGNDLPDAIGWFARAYVKDVNVFFCKTATLKGKVYKA